MIPTAFGVLAAGNNLSLFVGVNTYVSTGASQALVLPTGTATGDYCFIFFQRYTGTPVVTGGTGTGWTYAVTINQPVVGCLHKRLASGDITTLTLTGIASNTTIQVLTYRGPVAAALKSSDTSIVPSTSVSIPGFTKAATPLGFVGCAAENSVDITKTPAPPVSWATRVSTGAITIRSVGDLLNPASYTNGSAIVFTGFAGNTEIAGMVLEMT